MSEPLITKDQFNQILQAIESNFAWVSHKGCKVTDERKFITEILYRLSEGYFSTLDEVNV